MGMFNYLEIDDNFLPDELKGLKFGWQTKSYECLLDTLIITKKGKLLINKSYWSESGYNKIEEINYTGEIRFYDYIGDVRIEFVAFFERGNMLKIIRTE